LKPFPSAVRPLFLAISSTIIGLALSGCATADEIADTASSAGPNSSATVPTDFAQRRSAAAERGIAYLLEQAPAMPPAWRSSTFENLVKIVPAEALADACREQVEAANRMSMGLLPEVYEPALLRNREAFRSTLSELRRLKRRGDDWREPTRALAKLLAEHEDQLWKEMQPTQQLVLGYRLGLLGIETRKTAEDVIGALRLRWSTEDREKLLGDSTFMFGLTHVIFVRSGYFDRLLDPRAYAFETEVLDQATARYADQLPEAPIFIDIAAEVLTSRRLLRSSESQASRALAQRLIEGQSPDGSWGEKRFNRDTHATLTAVQALIEFPEPFRKLEP
jgi:hypothetical protein